MVWLTILTFGALFVLLVLVHEWGHFIVAKRAGCKVEEFGFGFPPRIWGRHYQGTLYSVNAIPLGGFVRIEGEDMDAETSDSPTSFANKPARTRIAILAAGVLMNIVLAVVLLGLQAGIGAPVVVTEENEAALVDHKTYINEVVPDSPAAAAGLTTLDRIVEMQGISDPTITDIQRIAKEQAGTPVTLTVFRGGSQETVTITPRDNPPAGEGALGVGLIATGLQRVPWWQAPWEGVKRTAVLLVAIVQEIGRVLGRWLQQQPVGEVFTGPVGIAKYAHDAAQMGASYFLEFGALISLNLALINIFPFPALDGGRIIFVLLEKLRGRPFSGRVEQMTHTVGFALLLVLMLVITFRDVQRFF